MADSIEERIHYLSRIVLQAEIGHCAPPDSGHAIEQIPIGGGTNPKAEYPRRFQPLLHCQQNVRFVSDEAVGQKANETKTCRIMRKIERGFDALEHHGGAVAVQFTEITKTLSNIGRRRRQRSWAECG